MNFNKSLPTCFSTQNAFSDEFHVKKLKDFALIAGMVTPYKETTLS